MKIYIKALLFLCVIFIVIPAHALIVPQKPAEGEYIADTTNLISKADEKAIQKVASTLYKELGIPIIVVTIDSLLSYTDGEYLGIEIYTKKLFNYWKIGSASHNYGILLLVSPGDKIARIQFGGGWGFLYDRQAQKIMDETMIPYFKKQQYSEGITAGVKELDRLARTKLKFLIDEKKIIAISIIFILIITAFMFFLIKNINSKYMKYQKIYACFVGFFYVFILLFHYIGVINYIEFLITMFSCLMITFISLLIYTFIYAKNHTATETLIQILTLIVMMVFAPMLVIVFFFLFIASNSEYNDGSADMGGGATGSWD